MMQRVFTAGGTVVPRRVCFRTITGAVCQKRPFQPSTTAGGPSMQQQQQRLGGSMGHFYGCTFRSGGLAGRVSSFSSMSAAPSAASPGGRRHELEGQEETAAAAAMVAAARQGDFAREVEEEGGGGGGGGGSDGGAPMSASQDVATESSGVSTVAPGVSDSHTVVKHPPAPGWEFPPVPEGCEPKFAVIRLGNTQYKVTKDDVIVAEKLAGDIGSTLEIEDVLLVGTREGTVVGRPVVPGAVVKLFVEEQTRDKKVIVLKKRRRKSSKTTQGHRREVTLLRVVDILS